MYFGHLMQRVDPLEKTLMLGWIGKNGTGKGGSQYKDVALKRWLGAVGAQGYQSPTEVVQNVPQNCPQRMGKGECLFNGS